MDAQPSSDSDRRTGPLPLAAKMILFVWIVFILLNLAWFRSVNSNAGAWEDMVDLVSVLFVVIGLVAVAIAWLIARFLVNGQALRILTAIFGPPLLFGLVPLTLWIL
jgi:hypothetical protein